jgi:hypothetical protein
MKDHQDTDDSAFRAYRKRQDAANPHGRAFGYPILGTAGRARRCHGSSAGPHGSTDERGSRADAERLSSCLEGADSSGSFGGRGVLQLDISSPIAAQPYFTDAAAECRGHEIQGLLQRDVNFRGLVQQREHSDQQPIARYLIDAWVLSGADYVNGLIQRFSDSPTTSFVRVLHGHSIGRGFQQSWMDTGA